MSRDFLPSISTTAPKASARDLESLGVFQPLYDGRLNIPDLFRMGYGLGRRGGVRPVR